MCSIFKKLLKLSSKLISVIWTTNDRLLDGFMPIVESREALEEISDGRLKKQYIFPFLLACYLMLESAYYLHTSGYHPEEPEMFHHVILSFMPVFFRRQNDVIFFGNYCAISILYLIRILDRIPHAKKVLMFSGHGGTLRSLSDQKVSRVLSTKLLQFWRRTKTKQKYLFYIVEFEANSAYTYPLLSIELYSILFSHAHFRFRNLFCGTLAWIYLHYTIAAIQGVCFFVIVNKILEIKQKHHLERMRFRTFRSFEMALRTLLNHTEEIRLWNDFFTLPISIVILAFGVISGSLLNGSLHSPEVPVVFLIPWIAFALFYIFLIFVFTASSSKTIDLNRKLFFKLREQQTKICSFGRIPYQRRIVRLDLVNEYKTLLLKTCFRLVTSSPLSNRLFFMHFFGLLSFVYMKTIDRK